MNFTQYLIETTTNVDDRIQLDKILLSLIPKQVDSIKRNMTSIPGGMVEFRSTVERFSQKFGNPKLSDPSLRFVEWVVKVNKNKFTVTLEKVDKDKNFALYVSMI